MKKCKILKFVAFFAICILMISCSKDDNSKNIVVAVLKDNVNTQYWQQVAKGITDETQQNDDISVVTYTLSDDGTTSQIEILRSLNNTYGEIERYHSGSFLTSG